MPIEALSARVLASADVPVEAAAAVPAVVSSKSAIRAEERPRRPLRSVGGAERARATSSAPEPSAGTPAVPRAAASPATPTTPACEPPFTLGPEGEKHYKAECFR